MKLVIVESPAKAKTINKYLGSDYQVVASFGHVRDLPAKDGSVLPDNDFSMTWAVDSKGEKHLKDIISVLTKADEVYLASDPDREGEAIAWHIVQELQRRKKLKVPVKRVVFNEITKSAVLRAIETPRQIDMNLVDAYLARRALDYLVGFNLSPVLWRKLPGSKSAGRVQSVALRLVCDREKEIESFKSEEYWTISATLETAEKNSFTALLTHVDDKKLDKFSCSNEAMRTSIKSLVERATYHVGSVEKKQVKRNPSPAFTTSTLQQEASRKLGFSAKKTMKIAQELYEGIDVAGDTIGLITYMRTDGIALAEEAISRIRTFIQEEYGQNYLPQRPRYYKNKVKNAQEAHEAIRPTDIYRTPEKLSNFLDKDHFGLYSLIFKRALACQMENALLDKVSVDIPSDDGHVLFHATGQTLAFPGFVKVYKEDIDDGKEEDNAVLPVMKTGDVLSLLESTQEQHFTEPPPRYSEASLVKKMEELGIGRPSTYASILSVLQEREYVRLDKKRFIPENRGRVVTAFLENFFNRYVEYDFTAQLENKLDDITAGSEQWKHVLCDFWEPFHQTIENVSPCRTAEVLEKIDAAMEQHLFPTPESRVCPECKIGTLSLKVSRFGAFIGCSRYPECKYTHPFSKESAGKDGNDNFESDIISLGFDGANHPVTLKKGPYGWYVQLGDGKEAKRVSLPKSYQPQEVSLTQALGLLSLPKILGNDIETNEPIEVAIGRFGSYVKRGRTFQSLTSSDDVLTIDLARAMALLQNGKNKLERLVIGDLKGDKILYMKGRYGPYLKWGKKNVALPPKWKSSSLQPGLEEAVQIIQSAEKK